MDVILKTHGAKDVYKTPEGLYEICTDISREVIRTQPINLYSFIADYVDALLITRENTKVAIRLVDNILKGSETIISILSKYGLPLDKIAAVAPQLQIAFKDYLNSTDVFCQDFCTGNVVDEKCELSIENVLQQCNISIDKANRAAAIIQQIHAVLSKLKTRTLTVFEMDNGDVAWKHLFSAFRRHYQTMLLREKRGEIQWQRTIINTINVMKKAGVSQMEINESIPILMSIYKGYYTRKNQIKQLREDCQSETETDSMKNSVQAVAWLEVISKNNDFTKEQEFQNL